MVNSTVKYLDDMPKEQVEEYIKSIDSVVAYNWEDEKKDFESHDYDADAPVTHIFSHLHKLKMLSNILQSLAEQKDK